MTLKSFNYYVGAAREAIKNDEQRDVLFDKIHLASRNIFENPEELRALPWIQDRKFVTTAPSDALNAAVRTFASRMPSVSIQPLSEEPEEYDRVENLESAMRWEFKRMNMLGKKSPHWKIVEYAMKYCAVAIETEYLPFKYANAKRTPRVKEILRSRNFNWNVHDPRNIHVRESDDVMESVLNSYVCTGQELYDMYGDENEGINQVLKDLKGDAYALNNTRFSFYDYIDWDARVKWVCRNGNSIYLDRSVNEGVEIMRKEREVSFIPWVYVDNEEPILRGMIDAGLWDNVNILRTMQFSKAVDMAAHPEYWIQTPDGTLRNVNIDNQNPNQPLVTGPGVNVQKLPPPMLDPQLSTMLGTAESEVFRTTVAQILASVEKYAGTQNFSVVNAMLNAAVAQLSLAQMAAERAETLAMVQNFRWIEESEIPLITFREYTKGESKKRGQEVSITKDDFDTEYLYLDVKLNPNTVMDKQTEINNAINKVERLGMSRKMAWDDLGIENYELSESQKSEEDLYQAMIQAEAQKIMMKPQMEMQAAMEQQAAAQQQQAMGPEQSQFAGQQGFDPRGGGMPAAMPGQGREQLTGQSASGQGLA